jgi:L-alanine-DL-glutamate epimerase-like enolase superfamily enzyme
MPASTDTIDRVEVFCLHIPYRSEVRYASTRDTHGVFALLRLTTKDGAVGIAEGVARPDQNHGEDVKTVAYQIENYFRPMLMGADPLAIDAIFGKMARIKKCRAAKALIDNALWDLKGKLLGEPIWRLLGGSMPKPVPISGIVFGYTSVAEMAKDAAKAVAEQGLRGFKIKTWKRSMEDVDVVREIRKAVGPDIFLYADANRVYTPGEARAVFPHFADHGIRMIEDPCKYTSYDDLARLAGHLPVPILADGCWETMTDVYNLARINAIGAVSVKLAKIGMTQGLKLIGLCEMAGLDVVIGTNTESRVGTLPMIHVWSAFRSLQAIPSETGFYRHLADDVYDGELVYENGTIQVPDAPGFGGGIDEKKLAKYRV